MDINTLIRLIANRIDVKLDKVVKLLKISENLVSAAILPDVKEAQMLLEDIETDMNEIDYLKGLSK